jgi:hypothetical protein
MRVPSPRHIVLIAAIVFAPGACIDRSDPTDPGAVKTPSNFTVAVQLPVASLEVGGIVSAVATLTDADGHTMPSAPVKWLSSDNSILAVSSGGQVTARKMGIAWVYATNKDVAGKTSLSVTDSIPKVARVSPKSATAPVGANMQLTVTVATASGRALTGHAIQWTSSDTRYATVSSTGLVTALAVGTARIIAAASSVTDTATVSITSAPVQAPVQTNSTSHEPSVMALLNDWDGHSLGAWKPDYTPTQQFVWDPSLQTTVMQMQYGPVVEPKKSTYGVGHLYYPILAAVPLHSIYLRAQIKLSANWVQNPSNVLKLFEVFSGRTWAIPGIYGFGSNLRLMVANDESTDPNYPGCFIGQNAPGCKWVTRPPDIFTLDKWHTIEILLVSSSPGVNNGRVKTWLDGRPQTDVSDVMWAHAGTDNSFSQFDLNPLWGGLGGTLTAPQWLSVGQIHLSGSSRYITGPIP